MKKLNEILIAVIPENPFSYAIYKIIAFKTQNIPPIIE